MRFFCHWKELSKFLNSLKYELGNICLFILHDLEFVSLTPEQNASEWKCCECYFNWIWLVSSRRNGEDRKGKKCHRKFRNVFQSASHFCSKSFVRIFNELNSFFQELKAAFHSICRSVGTLIPRTKKLNNDCCCHIRQIHQIWSCFDSWRNSLVNFSQCFSI